MAKTVLLGLLPEELTAFAFSLGMPKFTGKQLAEWIYNRRVTSFDEMTNISLKHRALLAEKALLGRYAPTTSATSQDGTRKYLFATSVEGQYVECVYIPEGDRATLCVSSQVGCKMNCLFCQTGKLGFRGNLTAAEILNQVFSIPLSHKLTNIVYMGMGEPLDNVQEVLRSIECLTHPQALAMSPKRITLSSIGLEPGLSRFLKESSCHLAISLHNPLPQERKAIMPIERAMPIENTIQTLRGYNFSGQRRLTFEYILFGGLNDTPQHAKALQRLVAGLDCHVNLIRYHRIPSVELPSTDEAAMELFAAYLNKVGIPTTIRTSRGEDIAAACGMLSAQHRKD